jgi:hypothetical protein
MAAQSWSCHLWIISLSRLNIVSTAECEYSDGVQTEELVFRVCKVYEDQRATMVDILSQNSKQEYPKSVTELLRLEEKKICARRLLIHKQNT